MTSVTEINSQLTNSLMKLLPEAGNISTAVEGVRISRRDKPSKITNTFYTPAVTLMTQGYKLVNVGGNEYSYGENQCLIVGVDMPVVSRILKASPEQPCMTVTVDMDKYIISQIAQEVPLLEDTAQTRGIATMNANIDLMNAFLRLIQLSDKKEEIPIIAPLVIREIHYRLLSSSLGQFLRQINTIGTKSNQIAQAISWLKTNYKQTLYIDNLAEQVNMGTSTLHRHFKEITALSPIQYQKRLRLTEAQRLMLTTGLDATNAAYEVGYESFTQFNKEYKRMYGEPPRRNINRIQTGVLKLN